MKDGFFFGKKNGEVVGKPIEEDGHVLVVGGSGSGKTSCVVFNSIITWGNSPVFAIDIKGELYENTYVWKQAVKVFNPLDDSSYGYDPYYLLRKSNNPAQEARAIAQAIIPLPPDVRETFWIESAQNILTAAILHYYKDFSFLETLENVQSMSQQELVITIAQSPIKEARLYINSFTQMDDGRTLAGIMAELSRGILTFVTDKNIQSAFSRKNNIMPDDLESMSSIFINVPEHLIEQWKHLINLIISQFLKHFEKRESNLPRILFILDEFPRLGKAEGITNALATLRSRGITMCLVIQSLAQLDMIYGETTRKVIADNCQYKAIFNASDADTRNYFSRLLGTQEEYQANYHSNFLPVVKLLIGSGIGWNLIEKKIIKPEEFATLKNIVLLTPYGSYMIDKFSYYDKLYLKTQEKIENMSK